MASDGQIVFEVTADGKHAIADIKDITRAIQQETGKWDDAAKESADNIGNSFSNVLKKLAAGFGAMKIGKALLDLGKDALEAASDLQEVQNVVDVTFGANSNKIEAWAKEAGTQFGLTETQAKKFSSTMGAMLKSSGLAGDQITEVSTDLAGLAADMASFYNLDFDEAFSKIRSGMSGMTMPLKELGIDMSVTTMNAFAMQKGLTKTFDQMSQGEQTMLRYQYLMSVTADAQGDFARTSDGYANSMRKLETNIESLKASLGSTFIGIVADAVGALNGFLEMLQPDASKRTVMDDFADVDLKTEEKLEDIRKTATEAGLLVEQLDKIGGEKASKAGSRVQQMVDDLTNINLDQEKAGIVTDFIGTLAKDIDIVADIQGTDAEGAKAWLEGIADSANKLDPDDANGWIALIEEIKAGLPGIENTDFGAAFFAALGGEFGDVSEQASTLSWVVDALGGKTSKTAQEQALWLETCKRLVKTIPGLSSIINTETGEVKGGTEAVKEYIKAWEEGQTKLAMMKALEEKETALSSRYSDIPGLQLDMALAQRRLRQQKEKLQAMADQMGITIDFERLMKVGGNQPNMWSAEQKAFNEAVDEYYKLNRASIEATDNYNRQAEALEEAEEALKEYRETIDEMPGNIDEVTNSTEDWLEATGKTSEEIQELVNNAQTALKDLADYVDDVKEKTASAISNTVKGFEKIETPMMKSRKQVEDLTAQMNGLDSSAADYAEQWQKINDEINKTQSNDISAQSMARNLEQQAQFMDSYLENLQKARDLGIDNQVLAQLADGSVESYDYLEALANAAPSEVKKINDNYQKVIDKKKEMTDELSQQQLTVDETYKSLVEKAKEAVAELDLETEAKDNAGKTISGMAQGIADHISEVQTAVDGILEQLNRLDGWGINLDLGGFGEINFTTSVGKKADASGRFGIGYVPMDDYLIRAHEGERLLTAQENQIWNALLNGGVSGFDLEDLGGVMRDNIRPGGNVYLDGKAVGNVISEAQGRSYKSLQRSGWQG